MSDLEKKELGKLVQLASDIQFENDFGQEPILMGRFAKDQGVIAVCSLVAFFVGTAITGNPIAGIVLLIAGANDIGYASRKRSGSPQPSEPEPIDVEAREVEEVEPKALPVGQETGLNAVEVESEVVSDRPQPAAQPVSTPNPSPQKVRSVTAYLRILDCPFESRAFFGAQRTGKTYLAAVSSYSLHLQGKKIYHINLGSFGIEDDQYWDHAKSIRGDLSILDANEAEYLIEDAISLVEEFFTKTGAILVVDEWAYLGSVNNAHAERLEPLMKLLADKISTLSSTGMKRQKAIWAIAPELVASSLTNQAKAIKKLKLCYVSIAPDKFIDWNGNAIGFNAELFEQVKNNFPITSPEGIRFAEDRICFIDNKWLSLGDLPSLPKFSQVEASVKATQTEEIATLEQTKELKVSEVLAENLGEPLKSIWLFTKDKNDWITVRDIQRKDFAVLKGKGSEQIHQYLGLLADSGYGEIDEEGKSHSSVRFKAN